VRISLFVAVLALFILSIKAHIDILKANHQLNFAEALAHSGQIEQGFAAFEKGLAYDAKPINPNLRRRYAVIALAYYDAVEKNCAGNAENPLLTKEGPSDRSRRGVVVIGAIANLYATKGIEYLIEAASITAKSYKLKAISYIVIGEGKERPKLEALIKTYNLENNFFLIGRISNATQYLKAFDIVVLPSVKEGFPWVLLDAMAAEVPIIATKVGAVPEVIEDNKDGLLVPPGDSKALAEKIYRLLNLNPKFLHLLHDRIVSVRIAREKLKRFSRQKMLVETYATLKL